MANGTSAYTAKSITVLEGLEAVRRRPGMYIGGVNKTGFHHLLWEIVNNSVDEVMNGHASRIVVALHADGKTMSVADDGRGIPVDVHPKTGKSALEVIFTTLHAGGKFDNDAYKVAGGLHGVGASVVNALSKSLIAEVRRDGETYIQRYRRGKPLGPVEGGEPSRGSGTKVTFTPDPDIFQDLGYDTALIAERLEVKTYLNKGLVIRFDDQKNKTSVEFRHDGGVADFLDAINRQRNDQRVAPLPFVLEREDEDEGLRCHLALAWSEATDEDIRSFVNTIPTRDGGTHELGVLAGISAAVMRFMETHDLVKKVEIKREDIREGLTAVIAVCVREPQFQGQTKGRLNNPEVKAQVESMVRPASRISCSRIRAWARQLRHASSRPPRHARPAAPRRRRSAARRQSAAGSICPASSPTATPPTPTNQSSSSSRVTAPAARPSKGATATLRRSCRSRAKSSTSSRRARPRCSTTRS